MKVKALTNGGYQGRRRTGDIFDCPSKERGAWMQPVSKNKDPDPSSRAKAARPEPRTLSEGAKDMGI